MYILAVDILYWLPKPERSVLLLGQIDIHGQGYIILESIADAMPSAVSHQQIKVVGMPIRASLSLPATYSFAYEKPSEKEALQVESRVLQNS